MKEEERKLALYCLKASSDYHSEVCEECVNYPNCDHTIQDDVTEIIIKALEQEPCDDAISRQIISDYVESHIQEINTGYGDLNKHTNRILRMIMEYIDKLPSFAQEPKTGHWITKIQSDLRGDMWPTNPKCSECGGEPYYSKTIYSYKFCPYCGTKMVELQESED